MSKGSAPARPQESEHSKTLANIAESRMKDYNERFKPVEMAYLNAVQQSGADTAYARAMAAGQHQAALKAGEAYQSAAARLAATGNTSGFTRAIPAGYNANADAVFGGYANQRANADGQLTGAIKIGQGIMDNSVGAFKAVADADTSRINSNFANQVGYDVAVQNANSALLSDLSKLGLQYSSYKSGQ